MREYFRNIAIAAITILQGMYVTLYYLVRPSITLQYPDEKWQMPERSRGFLSVDLSICTACKICEISCPVDCIVIDAEKDPEDKKKKWMTRFDIDISKCMFCSLCVDPCPTGAIFMTTEYEKVWWKRDEMVFRFIKEGDRVQAAKE